MSWMPGMSRATKSWSHEGAATNLPSTRKGETGGVVIAVVLVVVVVVVVAWHELLLHMNRGRRQHKVGASMSCCVFLFFSRGSLRVTLGCPPNALSCDAVPTRLLARRCASVDLSSWREGRALAWSGGDIQHKAPVLLGGLPREGQFVLSCCSIQAPLAVVNAVPVCRPRLGGYVHGSSHMACLPCFRGLLFSLSSFLIYQLIWVAHRAQVFRSPSPLRGRAYEAGEGER